MSRFGGLITAMITPMRPDGSVDRAGAAALAHHLVERGSEGLVVCGTTGESPTLSPDEKVELFRAVKGAVQGRAAVIAGTGTYATAESVHLSQRAAAVGCDGILAVVPYYNRPPQEGLYRHFKAIAAATDLPLMLYNIPGRTSQNLTVETVERLAQLPNIVAIKEASKDLDQVAQIRARAPEVAIYAGDDALTLPTLSVGGVGVVSVASHLIGPRLAALIAAFQAGRAQEAAVIHSELLPLLKVLFITTNPIPVKYACGLIGLPAGPCRLPLCEPTAAEADAIRRCLMEYGLLAA